MSVSLFFLVFAQNVVVELYWNLMGVNAVMMLF